MSQQNDCCMVLSTTNNEKNRDEIIKGLLEAQLAACIQTMPIESHYVWKGKFVLITNGYSSSKHDVSFTS